MTLLWVIMGLLLGILFARFAGKGSRAREYRIAAIGLIIAALIYVVFALVGGAPRRWLMIEVLGVALFGALALLGQRKWAIALALGWAAHVLWDVGLHLRGPGAAYTPMWYPLLCVGFDLVVAGALLATPARGGSRRRRRADRRRRPPAPRASP